MKKFFALMLAIALLATMTACGGNNADNNGDNNAPATLKFGLGVYVAGATVADATADKAGSASMDATYAAVSLDADGKIVAVVLDVMQHKLSYNADGTTAANTEFKSKYEKMDAYNMKPASPIDKEWYEQADAFKALVVGKTLAEVKALVAEGDKGVQAVIDAGCTMKIAEFVGAIEKACNNAVASNVTANDTLKIAAVTAQSVSNATADKAGSNQVDTTIVAVAMNGDKVVAASSDCLQVKFGFDVTGKSTFDTTDAKLLRTKKEKGDDYNMRPASPIGKEWYEQAAAFDTVCTGKTIAEIKALLVEGKGNDEVVNAGCTMKIGDWIEVYSKF